MTVYVEIIESEKGWGQRIDEVIPFETREAAEIYCKTYNNKYNTAEEVPDWYMYARIQGDLPVMLK